MGKISYLHFNTILHDLQENQRINQDI